MPRALLLFSGGLDSILATKVLREQGVKVTPVCFRSFFFDCDLARRSAKQLNLTLKVVDISKEHLKIVKTPRFGYGKGLNPCIDCHLAMVKKAKEIFEKRKFDILVTGEVLGERPFSQRKKILKLIEKKASLENNILRPLSAKLLPETIYEKEGLVEREKFFSIRGKSRKSQMKLAKKFKIREFPSPAGGCILTDPQYAKRLKFLLEKIPDFDGEDARLLKKGRIFWYGKFLIIIGRNEKENGEIKKMKKEKDIMLEPENFPGPTVLIRGFKRKIQREQIVRATELLLHYTKKMPEKIIIEIKNGF